MQYPGIQGGGIQYLVSKEGGGIQNPSLQGGGNNIMISKQLQSFSILDLRSLKKTKKKRKIWVIGQLNNILGEGYFLFVYFGSGGVSTPIPSPLHIFITSHSNYLSTLMRQRYETSCVKISKLEIIKYNK